MSYYNLFLDFKDGKTKDFKFNSLDNLIKDFPVFEKHRIFLENCEINMMHIYDSKFLKNNDVYVALVTRKEQQ